MSNPISSNNVMLRLKDTANASRLNTVEAAYAGSTGAQSNFKGRWQGFNNEGNGIIRIAGKDYAATTIGSASLPFNAPVILRVGKGIKTSHW